MVTAPDDVWEQYLAVSSFVLQVKIHADLTRFSHWQAHPSAVKWRTKAFPMYDEMLALVEGRHATGENAFRVIQLSLGDAKSDGEVNRDSSQASIMIARNNSFKFEIGEGPENIEKPFSDWVRPHLYFSVFS